MEYISDTNICLIDDYSPNTESQITLKKALDNFDKLILM